MNATQQNTTDRTQTTFTRIAAYKLTPTSIRITALAISAIVVSSLVAVLVTAFADFAIVEATQTATAASTPKVTVLRANCIGAEPVPSSAVRDARLQAANRRTVAVGGRVGGTEITSRDSPRKRIVT